MKIKAGGYPEQRMARAFLTALTHEDAATRERADARVQQWAAAMRRMSAGEITVGSRTPVRDWPAWLTPQVLTGGFASGTAAAGGSLRADEVALASREKLPRHRSALFAYHLSDAGMAALNDLLDSGRYRADNPEETALLTVAWLLRSGDRDAALAILDEIAPFTDQVCFAPAPAMTTQPEMNGDPTIVWRETATEVQTALRARKPNSRMESMREALTIWNPFADEVLTHWNSPAAPVPHAQAPAAPVPHLQAPAVPTPAPASPTATTRGPDFPAAPTPVVGDVLVVWQEQGRDLLARYRELAAVHTWCSKHRKPKENLAILLSALREVTAGRELTPRAAGLLRQAIAAMTARRGAPGSDRHAGLRAVQAAEAAKPSHLRLAGVVADRIQGLDPRTGIRDIAAVCVPVDGSAIPPAVVKVVRRATAGTVAELVAGGVLPSAESLARLVPQISAAVHAAPYADPALRRLAATTYRAFRTRRSLLLLDLQHQVGLGELPWVRAVQPYRQSDDDLRAQATTVLRELAVATLDGFPATVLPNPLVREFGALSAEAGEPLPWTEELAADIFMGRFSHKFARAATIAGELLGGSLYARYYDIDFSAVTDFSELCRDRARDGQGNSFGTAANGMVIEQAQILTTHNLALMAHTLGVAPTHGWRSYARLAFADMIRMAIRLDGNPRPLPVAKDIAYAWRQVLFALSTPAVGDPGPVLHQLRVDLAKAPAPVWNRLAPALTGADDIVKGHHFTLGVSPHGGRRLLGWSTGRNWLLALR